MQLCTRVSLLIVIGMVVLSLGSAWAFDCPSLHKALTAYYEKTAKAANIDQAKLTQAQQLLDQGLKDHEARNHKDSVKKLAAAMDLINAARP